MRLLIDDCPRRREQFRKAFGVTVADTPESPCEWSVALAAYVSGQWEPPVAVYLDHDLGDIGWNGETLAYFVKAASIWLDTPIHLHSANVIGSQRMYDILKDTHDVRQVSWADVVGEGGSDV